ncbi:MAG TPA: GNAT family N-acetyltransferase [Albitalea sp.]|nr:GNAT family N-acetyltransferase [Albitalea sp.]
MTIQVEHNPQHSRFEAHVDGHLCVADYRVVNGVMVMPHTYVPPPVEGRGIAASLVEAALAHARDQQLRVDPRCSYVRSYMRRHPETQSLQV